MRIGVDTRPLREKQTSGIPMYVRSLLESLASIDSKNEYILYCHKDFNTPLPGPNFRKRSGALTRFGNIWMQTELPFWLKQDRVDVFWGTQHVLPVFMEKHIKGVLTVHDLVQYAFPDTMKMKNLWINKIIIPPSVHRADVIVAESNWTIADVKKFINPKNKIMKTVYLGVGPTFFSRDKETSRKKIKEQYGIDAPFLLTVGTFEPRKNIAGLFRAFSLIADKIPHHLAVVGQKGWKNKKITEEISGSRIKNRIHLLGFVPDDILPEAYSASDLFVFPSLYEGFGFPPLEAMACAVPVVASNVSSIPEVVGDAAMLVNPHDARSISEGILKVVSTPTLQKDLVERGLKQASLFTWKKTADEMLKIFEQVGNS
ncbi:MAG: D-inositol-3-phosphate glycosyltransferase [Elusimicrobia bacterium]|nr:D-inositol-3-phosphate glycosyltransferase [Elusimicrobiota bacterium]